MDREDLERLRAKYASAKGSEMADPLFARIAAAQFRDGETRKWPFADPATLLGAPFRPDAAREGYSGLDVALAGVPMDLGVTNRAGARLGPRAVRAVERIGPYDQVLHMAPLAEARVADVGDVPMRSRFSLESCHEDIERFYDGVRHAGVPVLSVGGDHSISLPILRALGRDRPLGMIHIDAHADTSGPYEGTKFHHGGPFRQAVLDGVLDPRRVIQLGIRGGASWLWEFSHDSGMTVLGAEEVVRLGIPAVAATAREVVGAGPVYLSFDVDSIDPGFAPGTGTPEVGGLAPREVIAFLRALVGVDVVSGDVVEVAPQYDATTNTAHVAAQVAFQILCLILRAPSYRPRR